MNKTHALLDNLILDPDGKKYYEDFDTSTYGNTLEPGSAPAPWLYQQIVDTVNPTLIIEVGSYLGFSAIGMAKRIKETGKDCKIICVDTFLGGPDHFFLYRSKQDMRLGYKHGYPSLYYKFITNVILNNVQDVIYPLPYPSTVAFKILEPLMKEHGVQADVVFIDGSHETHDVYMDLYYYYQLVKPGGLIVGDDWAWATVRAGVRQFIETNEITSSLNILQNQIHWTITK